MFACVDEADTAMCSTATAQPDLIADRYRPWCPRATPWACRVSSYCHPI